MGTGVRRQQSLFAALTTALTAQPRACRADYTIQCFPTADGEDENAGKWWALAVISFAGLIVVSAGFPLGCAFLMRRRMKRETEMVRKQEKSSVISQRDFGRDFSFIAGEYKPEACKRKDITGSRI